MTDDITTVLIGIIKNHSAQYSNYADGHAAAYGGSADALGISANWAQILGTAEGPLAQEAAVTYVTSAGTIQGQPYLQTAAGQAEAITAGAAAAGIGAGIVLFLAGLLGILSSSSGTDSAQEEQMAQLGAEFQAMVPYIVADYWDPKLGETGAAAILWSDVQGYLDDLNAQGTGGNNVQSDEPNYHHAAQKYVNAFYNGEGWEGYWQSPPPVNPATFLSWYGDSPYTPPSLPGSSNLYDPTTALPFFVLGLNAYLTLEAARNMINHTDQTTLLSFASDYHDDLIGYLKLLYQQYSIAVTGHDPNNPSPSLRGIAKTAPPSADKISGFVGNPEHWEGLGWINPADPDQAQYPWNGCYGVLVTYPSYAVHQQYSIPGPPPWPTLLEIDSPSYFINLLNTNMPPSRATNWGDPEWITPWIQNKVTLGTMARWKALYLINGYDQVWQLMHSLQYLVNQALQNLKQSSQEIVPPVMHLDDGTIADGNWSARELCNVLQIPGPYSGYSGYDLTVYLGQEGSPDFVGGYSVNKLLHFLIAISGLQVTSPWYDVNVGRPLSFRALLAACDDESYSLPLTPSG